MRACFDYVFKHRNYIIMDAMYDKFYGTKIIPYTSTTNDTSEFTLVTWDLHLLNTGNSWRFEKSVICFEIFAKSLILTKTLF